MKKTNLKEKLQNWKLGNYFRELSIVTAGVFITLAGTDFINSASQEKQINKSMQMIKMELEENLKSINQAEAAYLNEINFGIKEQIDTITNSYNKWLYLFHISSC